MDRDEGFVSIEFMVAVALSMIVLFFAINFVVIQYGRGIVRAAADEGARAGALVSTDPVAMCNQRAQKVSSGIEKLASNMHSECAVNGGRVQAVVSADFKPWVAFVPQIHEESKAAAVKETGAP